MGQVGPIDRRPAAIAVGGLLAMAAAVGIGRFVYTPIVPEMASTLKLTTPEVGFLASANYLGYLIGALAAARVALPGGRHGWFLGALAVSAATTAAMGATESVTAFAVLRFVGGVASAYVLVLASVLVLERLAMAGHPALSAIHFAGVGSGIAVSAILVAGLAASGSGWQTQWLGSGVLALAALCAVAMLVPGDAGNAAAAPQRATDSADPTTRGLGALIAAYGLVGFGYVITATFIAAMVRASARLQPIEPVIWLAVGLAAIPSVAWWTRIGRRRGNGTSFALASLVLAFGVALSVLSESAIAVLIAGALLGGTFMGLTALGLIHARDLSPGDPRRAVGLMTASFGLGQMIGPAFAGLAHDLGGGFIVPSLVASAGLVVAALLVRDRRIATTT